MHVGFDIALTWLPSFRCDPGYYGLKCEFERPCTSHPCGDAMCIELPVSDEMSDYKFPVCVCNFDQAVNNNSKLQRSKRPYLLF